MCRACDNNTDKFSGYLHCDRTMRTLIYINGECIMWYSDIVPDKLKYELGMLLGEIIIYGGEDVPVG